MRRTEAIRKHRRAILTISALAMMILLLLGYVAPWMESVYQVRGIQPEGSTLFILRIGRRVAENMFAALLLTGCLLGFLWTSYGALDRFSTKSRSSHDGSRL